MAIPTPEPRAEPPAPTPAAALAPDPTTEASAAPEAAPVPVAEEAPAPTPSIAAASAPAAPQQQPQAPALKRFVVPYKAFEGQSRRIIIPVKLNGRVTADLALDTGAPETVIFAPLAERLGVFEKGTNRLMTVVGGLGGQAPAVLVVLDSLSVDQARTEFVPATVTASMTDAFEGLVGMDFLAGYSVQIDTQKHQLVLTELPPSRDRPAGHDEAWWRHAFTEFEGQLAYWQQARIIIQKRISSSNVSGDGSAEVLGFVERQQREAEQLVGRLERYASYNAVPREWRRE
ncbi:MAG: retropepsin-like aspartic protease [Anaeromyxobacter sp.]